MPSITRITEQQRRANRRSVYLDGRFAFGLNINVVARFRLREGMALDEQQVEAIKRGEVRQECLDAAMRHLQRRLHGRKELQMKLRRREYPEDVVEAVLGDLERMQYVDDARFALARAEAALKHKHHGRRRAFMDLMRAGVSPEVARKALDTVYAERSEGLAAARELAQRQAARLARLDPQVVRRRLAGMLQRRGFDYETMRPVLDEVLGREGE